MGVIPTDLCIWGAGASHVQNRLGQLTGFSFKLAGLQQLSAFYLHTIDWCLQLHSTPVEHARSRTCTPSQTWLWRPHYCIQPPPASLRIRRCQAICYFHSHVFGCIVSRKSSSSTLPELNPHWNLELISYAPPISPCLLWEGFNSFFLIPSTYFFFNLNTLWHTNILFVLHTPQHKISCGRYMGVKWQAPPPVSRLTWRAVVREVDRKWRRGGVAGGVWRDSISIRVVLDFPTFQNKDTNFSQFLSGAHRKNHIIFHPPFHALIILLSTVEF